MSITTAFRAFFAALGSGEKSRRISDILNEKPRMIPAEENLAEKPAGFSEKTEKAPAESAKKPEKADFRRHEALTLLAAFQREARFLDFLQEDLSAYSDAQVGAAVRDVHRQCGDVITRMFAPAPLLDAEEEAVVPLPEKINPAAYNLTGNLPPDAPPARGTLIHHGWRATKCDIPRWTGKMEDAEILAPAEVEV